MRKKLLSLLLAALMILGLLPAAALAAEGDAAPAVQAAEDVAVQADEETVAPPIVKVDGTAYDVTYVGVANSYGDQLYKVTVPSGTESVTLFWQAAADAGNALVCCPCHLIDNLTANTGTATFPLTGHGENEEAGAVSAEYCTEEQLASLKADGRSLSFAQFIYYAANGDVAGCAVIAIEVEADDSGSGSAITVTVDGTAYEVKNTGTVTADSKAAPIYKVVVPNGTAAVTGHWGMLVTRGYVACPCGACTVSLNDLKASNGTFTLPLTGHSGEEAAAVSKGYFATAEALQNIKNQSYQKMVFAWMRCKDADGNWCYALLCVEIEGVTNSAPALASGVTLYTVVAPDGETYTTDVTKFFTDEDAGDTLTYYVSVNGGEFEKLEKPEAYTYTYGENFVNARLTFKANDGKADSLQNCTVILNNPEYPVVKGADSSTTNTTTGTAVRLSIGSLISHPQSISLNYFVSIDGGEYKQVTLSSNKYTYAPTKAGTHTLLFKASTAKTLEDGKTSGVYTWTVTATGADIDNHAPVVKNPTEGPGQLGSSVNVTYWKPDLASIFSDPDGDTLTYSYSIDGSDFSEYYPTVGIHADYLKPDGTHTVTIRATDPYGEYAEFTVTIEKSTNHLPTKKADAPGKLSVFVPVGLTYTVDANLYYEDVDAKDQGKLRFLNNRFQSAGSYTASTVGDTKTETAYGADSVDRSVDGIEITYTAIGIDKEDTATTGVAYTIDPAALDGINIPGNYKVRVSSGTTGGVEQSFDGTFTVTPEEAAVYTIHIYGDKSAATADNYVVQLTVEKPNTPPTLREGVETSVKSYGYEDIAWELDLSTIFHDADGDALTYKVSVNGADPVEAAEKYSYVCGAANATLKFTANDGKADSDKTYTVTLNVEPKTKLLLESGSSEVAVGTPFTLAMSTIFENGYGVTIYVSINGAEKEFVNSGNVKSVTFSRAFANPGVYTLEFYEKHGPTFVGPYTHTLTVTGEAIENHAPVVQNPTEGPGQLGSGVNVTYWKPDLASIFSDPDGDTLTYSYSIDGARFSDYYTSVGIHADYLKPDGTHTVTIRATDPYGEYADLTVTIEKLTNHTPTKKADAPSSLSVFVPVGITYEVDANLYYEDVDAKDQGNLRFKSNRYGSAGKYTASAVGDMKTETAYGNDTSNSNAASGIKITYTAIAIDTEGTLTTGETYTVDPAALDGINIPGSYKVRVTNGTKGSVEQSFDGTFSFIPKTPGTYVVHIYGDKSSTAEENYVVKLTVTGDYLEWPTIEKFELSTVTGAAVDGEDGDQTLTVKDIQIEQYEKLKDNQYGDSKVAGCITITLDDSFVTKGRSWIQIPGKTAAITASEGATPGSAVNRNKKFYQTGDYMLETAYYVATNDLSVAYTVKFIQSAPITFAPVIGNGTAAGTTENNVTTFPAGSGTGAPTVTVTAPASGWAAGENTFTVACDKACVVLVKSGETYTKLTAANSGETHSFTATLAEGDEIIVRLKGDVNGDGVVNNTDTIQARAASLGKATLTEINAACAKVVGGTAVTNTDVIQIGAVALGKAAFQW